MKRNVVVTIALVAAASFAGSALAATTDAKQEFQKRCAMCHPDGGNSIAPAKTLKKKDLVANKIKTSKDLVAYLRKPGPGMTAFDAKSLPDKEAKAIADYVLKTFK